MSENPEELGTAVVKLEEELSVTRDPATVLNEARRAASALKDVINKKKKKVMFNGKQYLEFEDWQTVGKFYGVTAKVVDKRTIDFGEVRGFEATAVAYHIKTGKEISRAEGMCLNDEANWKAKPLFQLSSMAQTRACAKVLRNVLSWVVVLAGYAPTPAEEMTGQENGHTESKPKDQTVKVRQVLWDNLVAHSKANNMEVGKLLHDLTGKRSIGELTEAEINRAQLKFESEYLNANT